MANKIKGIVEGKVKPYCIFCNNTNFILIEGGFQSISSMPCCSYDPHYYITPSNYLYQGIDFIYDNKKYSAWGDVLFVNGINKNNYRAIEYSCVWDILEELNWQQKLDLYIAFS